ncbi:hypothetical protein LG201_02190 [Methylobacillus gramineus]|uniref:hypothetical protein n=1 Tax=Methylobacillus gramineus TaxID=755169 RepID=UPI001CFFC89B|nr:hypothetical protein [Methylobacillus gramineus]MCB5184011.1 hypothetical protein [Methylobacillus gramineus]
MNGEPTQHLHNLFQLETIMGLQGSVILSLCNRGLLPKPIRLPDGDIAWKVSDMNSSAEAWADIVAKINKSNGED